MMTALEVLRFLALCAVVVFLLLSRRAANRAERIRHEWEESRRKYGRRP